ncbi:MAG: hypothetical protein ACLUPV_02490 [Bilophila wadsworthia]
MTGSASFTARPTSPAAFLSSLKGKGEALIEKGNLSLSRAKKEKSRLLSIARRLRGREARRKERSRVMPTPGRQGSLTTPAGQSSLDLTGALQFPTSGPFNLRRRRFRFRTLSANGIGGQASGKLSLNTQANTLEAKELSGSFSRKTPPPRSPVP